MKAEKLIQTIGSLTGWFAVVTQLYLIIENRVAPVAETVIRFFSFYTILTNILVATCFTVSWFSRSSRAAVFFRRYRTVSAITVYIFVVGIVYNIILRWLWKPEGMQRLVDEILHSFVPILFVIYWIIFPNKQKLEWRNAFPWLLYPGIYLAYILLRGIPSHFYPYPFLDVGKLGYSRVLINCCYLFVTFLSISWVVILVSRTFWRREMVGISEANHRN